MFEPWQFAEYASRGIYTDLPGMRWANIWDPENGMLTIWIIFLAEWAGLMLVALYLDQACSGRLF